MSSKHMRKNPKKPFLWLCGLFLCLPIPVLGALFQVDQVSEPAGFLSQSSAVEEGSSLLSLNPSLVSSGYTFGYWTIDGVRQTAPDGRSLTRVSSVINAASTYKAHYFQSNADTDSDGVLDWYEYRMFGDLSRQPGDDSDGDGYSNLRESELGQDALIPDEVKGGGIAGRLSTGFVYADNTMLLATVKSNPSGFVSETSNFLEQNASLSTVNLHGATNSYHFAYWTVNGVRQAAPTGVSSSKVQINVQSTTDVVAHYVPSNQDNDGDGVMDWFELYQFGNLNSGPSDDSDGDGYSNKREGELGQEATIVDEVENGGIAGRLSTGFVYADTSMVLTRVTSDPPGYVTNTSNFLEINATLSTQNLHGASNGYHFAYWAVNGVRQSGPTGVSSSKVDWKVSETTDFVAHYVPSNQDNDGDGIMDWAELYQFGNLNSGPSDDFDGDGYSDKIEGELGQEATIFDAVEGGGIASRLSVGALYFMQVNNSPDGLDLNDTIVHANKAPGEQVGIFQPSDPDVSNGNGQFVLSLLEGNGSTDRDKFSISGMNLLTTSILGAGNYSISVRVSDEGNASLDKNFTITAIHDPGKDNDGDGLTYAQEQALGTSDGQTDSDGDGFSDAFEFAYGSDPASSQSRPNSAPVAIDLNGSTLSENQPAGTIVGEFNATDPDANATFVFSLLSGTQLFNLDTNGTLRTLAPFDYETNATDHPITVRVTDESNASLESNFTIRITNEMELLDLNGSSLVENRPEGTYVGRILVADPDANATLSYSLIHGSEMFGLDANGILRSSRTFDYETNSTTHRITVRVSDEHNVSLDGNFTIALLNQIEDFDGDGIEDAFDPDDVIYLMPQIGPITVTLSENGRASFSAGFTQNPEFATPAFSFELSADADFNRTLRNVSGLVENDRIHGSLYDLQPGSAYHVRTLATHRAKTMHGESTRFETAPERKLWWKSARKQNGSWRTSPWLGSFLPDASGWIYHSEMDWLYVQAGPEGDLWLWQPKLGWLWTARDVFPHLYGHQISDWYYFLKKEDGTPWFYDYSTESVQAGK
ncbi:cadherin domain-containing protein [Verrucomicrobia bacterium]|nr:cadherin domain-containing protein [Verrucomicrobiota bacterium]